MTEKQTLDQATKDAQAQGGPPAQGGDNRSMISALAVQNPPSPIAFQFLNVGPELTIDMEDITTDQIDNTRQMLRNLSPFVIQIEPPTIFSSYQNSEGNSPQAPQVTLYDTANGTAQRFQSARDALARDDGLMGVSGFQTTTDPETFLVGLQAADVDWNSLPAGGDGSDLPVIGTASMPDILSVVDISLQLANIMNIPPLVLLINPTSFQVQYTKIQQFQDRSRYGYILHTWGEDQPKISFTAKCGAFISGGRGVHVASRRDSKSWQNLMNLMRFYKNNGYIYDTVNQSNAHLHVGLLSIRYDNMIYYGNMDNFTFELNEENQLGGVEFNISFVANAIMDTAPDTNMVMPMRAPLPSYNDQRYAGIESRGRNRPGHYSIGFNDKWDLAITTQGREIDPGDGAMTLLPQEGVVIFNPNSHFNIPSPTQVGMTNGLPDKPVGDKGLANNYQAPTPGAAAVRQTQANAAEPFGF